MSSERRCEHDHAAPSDPLFTVSAHLRTDADGGPLVHITLEHCPHLCDAELAAIAGALSRALADVSTMAIAAVAQGN